MAPEPGDDRYEPSIHSNGEASPPSLRLSTASLGGDYREEVADEPAEPPVT